MPSTAAPFGLKPIYHGGGGIVRPTSYAITSGYSTSILAGGPVKIVPSSTGNGTIAAAAAGDRSIGCFMGVRYTDANGITIFSNKWTASTTGTDIECWVTEDPNIFYEIQANASLTQGDIGGQYDWSAESGNTTVGNSNISLNVASASATSASLQVVGLRPSPVNAWGDTYPNVIVRINEHQFAASLNSF